MRFRRSISLTLQFPSADNSFPVRNTCCVTGLETFVSQGLIIQESQGAGLWGGNALAAKPPNSPLDSPKGTPKSTNMALPVDIEPPSSISRRVAAGSRNISHSDTLLKIETAREPGAPRFRCEWYDHFNCHRLCMCGADDPFILRHRTAFPSKVAGASDMLGIMTVIGKLASVRAKERRMIYSKHRSASWRETTECVNGTPLFIVVS